MTYTLQINEFPWMERAGFKDINLYGHEEEFRQMFWDKYCGRDICYFDENLWIRRVNGVRLAWEGVTQAKLRSLSLLNKPLITHRVIEKLEEKGAFERFNRSSQKGTDYSDHGTANSSKNDIDRSYHNKANNTANVDLNRDNTANYNYEDSSNATTGQTTQRSNQALNRYSDTPQNATYDSSSDDKGQSTGDDSSIVGDVIGSVTGSIMLKPYRPVTNETQPLTNVTRNDMAEQFAGVTTTNAGKTHKQDQNGNEKQTQQNITNIKSDGSVHEEDRYIATGRSHDRAGNESVSGGEGRGGDTRLENILREERDKTEMEVINELQLLAKPYILEFVEKFSHLFVGVYE